MSNRWQDNKNLFLTGTVRELIERLQALNPDAIMQVRIIGEETDCEYEIDEVIIRENWITIVVNDDNVASAVNELIEKALREAQDKTS